ncbi:MAG: NDP-sugar synthase [Acidobacteria bacterium]|nr:NDP-sugar synthase [Acidobacteriota bacterium]
MHSLDAKRSLVLLPLGDRPLLQHIVESLVAQGIVTIELIVCHAPEAVEALLGNGDRWGCKFRYHLAAHPERPYRSLKIIPEIRTQPWSLIHAESYPCVGLADAVFEKPTLFYGITDPVRDAPSAAKLEAWKGTAVFAAGAVSDSFANQTIEELQVNLEGLASSSEARVIRVQKWLDASTPASLLETQTMLLGGSLDGIKINGMEREPGIWISRNVVIHPTVELTAPLYVGPNSRLNRGVRLGPNAVIEGECIVDTNTTIEHSLVTAGSYVGEGLELNKVLVDHNLLINARLGTGVDVVESFLLGGLNQPRKQSWLILRAQSVLAVLLILLFLPVSILAAIVFGVLRRLSYVSIQMVQLPSRENEISSRGYSLLCLGADAWSVPRKAGWRTFLRQFLPGLFAVAKGRIGFVGLPPRTPEEIEKLPTDWRVLYLGGSAGLITEAALSLSDPADETQRYLADAYYVVRRSFIYNLKLSLKYFLRLVFPADLTS